jgi:putative peptide zinc metalloprotease protein
MIGIAFYLIDAFLVVGVVLATWAIFMQLVRPLFRAGYFLATSPRLAARRLRGFAVAGGTVALIGVLVMIPAPLVTQTEGVVWLDEDSQAVSAAEGFVAEVRVESGAEVQEGELLLRLEDAELAARRAILRSRLAELEVQQAAERQESRVRAAMVAEDIAAVKAELGQVQEQLAKLDVRSPGAGRFVFEEPHELIGRFIRQGEIIGYLLQPQGHRLRAVVEQDDIGLLHAHRTDIEVRLANRLGESMPAELMSEVPAGSAALPSRALGAAGGGKIAVDGTDEAGLTATQRVFQLELALPPDAPVSGVGERAYVRFDHGYEPLWRQWARSLRQLFLSRLEA